MSIANVITAWTEGRKLKSRNVSTDGRHIYSWGLCIGETVAGAKVAIDHRGRLGSTTRHCGLVMDAADRTRAPKDPSP